MLCKTLIVSALAFAATVSGTASAVPFVITDAKFTKIGTGYGTETNTVENGASPSKLDVTFSNLASFTTQNFDLTSLSPTSVLFNFGTVKFDELNIALSETLGDLGIEATFTFLQPGVGPQTISTIGKPVLGPSNGQAENSMVDFSIDWTPVTVNFGTTGSFLLDLTDLAFTQRNQTLDASARITLLTEDEAPSNDVPEPGTLALAALGLAAAGTVRRRKR